MSLRLLRAMGDIATATSDAEFRRTLADRGRRVAAGCTETLGEAAMKDMCARVALLVAFSAGNDSHDSHDGRDMMG